MVKVMGGGVAKTNAPPPPSVLGASDVIGKDSSLLIVVETWVAMGVASGIGEQEYVAVVEKSDSHRI